LLAIRKTATFDATEWDPGAMEGLYGFGSHIEALDRILEVASEFAGSMLREIGTRIGGRTGEPTFE
jgi:hypothetical protein